jgi:2-polyprenyl-3-methyl-5-hydroxy-6-metoxy-1,4-benzoquinol methylase
MVADKGVAAKKIEVIGHGADLEVFQPLGVDRSFRESMGLTGKFVAVYAGAHGWANGLELVIEAAELIQNEYQEADIAFLLVGDGREKDGLKRRAARLKLENVIFLDRHAKRDIPRILSSCDVGLMILRPAEIFTTASPNKFFEYLACGLPVLVNFPGELQETIQAHQVGLFIEPASPKALAEAVVCLRRTPEQRAKMGQEARRLAEQNFSWRERAKQLETLLVELVKGKGTPELGAYELEEADCPLCGSAGRKVLYEEEFKSRKLGIVRCGGCGLIFTTPRLSTSSRARLYGEAQLAGISRKYGWTDKVDEGQYRGFFSYCAASRLDSGRLLDVGCGSGRFLEEAGNRGWQVFGLEPAVPPFQQAKKILGDSVLNCTLNEAQFPDGHFDVTTAWGVLEHVADPVGLLKGMARVTRDGGRVVVSVPNFRYLRLKDAGIISRVVRGRRSELHPEEHLFFFTPSSLRKVFAGAGLRVERMDLASPYYLGGRLSNLLKRLAYVGAKSLFVCTGVNLAGIVYYGRKG